MRFNLTGRHLLGGRQSAGVFVDGRPYMGSAGNWGWVGPYTFMGPGGYNSPNAGFYYCSVDTIPARYSEQLSTEFYGNGRGAWCYWYADGVTGSIDHVGNQWRDRMILDVRGDFQIFTDTSGGPLIFRNMITGAEQWIARPATWEPFPDGSDWFSRQYRGCVVGTTLYACGYVPEFEGLCVWRPFGSNTPTWLISATGTDYNPDIALRDDGMVVVGSGLNQGETNQSLYELDVRMQRFRRVPEDWQPLVPATHPPLPPISIAPFTHNQYVACFFATGQYGNADHAGNSEVLIRANYADMVRKRPVFADMDSARTVPDGMLRGIYTAAIEGGSSDANINEAIAYAVGRRVPVLIYSDTNDYPQWVCDRFLNDSHGRPIPNRIPVVQAYPKAKNPNQPLQATPAEDVARIRSTVAHLTGIYPRVAIAHTYYTQTGNYPVNHIYTMQPGLADIERDYKLFASLGFALLRPSGMKDNPDLAAAYKEECRATPGEPLPILLPVAPIPPQPEPPQPQPPEPHPPEPIPPTPIPPEEPTMTYGQRILFRKLDPVIGEQRYPNGTIILPGTWLEGIVVKHGKDEEYLDKGISGFGENVPATRLLVYAISANYAGGGAGYWITFNDKGEISGYQNDPNLGPGYGERVTFDPSGGFPRFMVVRPNCAKNGSGVHVLYEVVRLL